MAWRVQLVRTSRSPRELPPGTDPRSKRVTCGITSPASRKCLKATKRQLTISTKFRKRITRNEQLMVTLSALAATCAHGFSARCNHVPPSASSRGVRAISPRLDVSLSSLAPLALLPVMAISLPKVAASIVSSSGNSNAHGFFMPSIDLPSLSDGTKDEPVSLAEVQAQWAAAAQSAQQDEKHMSAAAERRAEAERAAAAALAAQAAVATAQASATRAAAEQVAAAEAVEAEAAAERAAADRAEVLELIMEKARAEEEASRAAAEAAALEEAEEEDMRMALALEEAARRAEAQHQEAEAAAAKAEAINEAKAAAQATARRGPKEAKKSKVQRRAERQAEEEAVLRSAGIYVMPHLVRDMSYRSCQSACKALGLPARGKTAKLKQRLSRVDGALLERLECVDDECELTLA